MRAGAIRKGTHPLRTLAGGNGREDHMLWKLERAAGEEPFDARPAPERLDAVPPGEAYPTPGEVFHEIGATLATSLALALAVNLLLNALGI